MKILFFVNGFQEDAAGIRAKTFAQSLPSEWNIHIHYRPITKWKGVFHFIRAALQFNPQIIYVMDTAYTGILAGYISKKLFGCKLVTDTGDVAYELAKSEGKYSSNQLALIKWVEQLAIQHSDCLVVRGSYHKHFLEQQGIYKSVFVPDGVDIDIINYQPSNVISLRASLGLDSDLVIGLVGTMIWSQKYQMCYGWDIIETLALLRDKSVKALLVGDGDGRHYLEKRARELNVSDRVIFTGSLPYNELQRYISVMDVCISTQSNDLVGMVRTTGKLPLYLAYGKYVIATDVGEAKLVLPGIGSLLPYEGVKDNNYPKRLALQINKLLEKPQLLQVFSHSVRTARENFDYNMLAKRIKILCVDLSTKK
jgi:glycosyltransferase involved in cell wall biosynthesis